MRSFLKEHWLSLAVLLIFFLSLFLSYYDVLILRFPMAPGDDVYPHLTNMVRIRDQGLYAFSDGYPPGLYLVVLWLGKLFSAPLIDALRWVAPALLPLSGLAIYWLAATIFSRRTALLAYALYALVLLQPLQTYYDGSLPNLLAAGIAMPVAFTALVRAIQPSRRRRWLWVGLFLVSTVLLFYSHHLTALVFLGVLIVFGTVLWLRKVFSWPGNGNRFLGIAGLLAAFLLLGWAFFALPIFQPARSILEAFVDFSSRFPFVQSAIVESKPIWGFRSFGLAFSGLVFQASLLSVAVLLWRWRSFSPNQKTGVILLAVWFILYFLGSRTPLSGEPERLARDLALPAAILAAWALKEFYLLFSRYLRPVAIIFLLAALLAASGNAVTRFTHQTQPTAMLRFSWADQEAYNYLIDSGLSRHTQVLTRDGTWTAIAYARNDLDKFAAISLEQPAPELVWKTCYLTGWYFPGVWPDGHTDKTNALTYLNHPELAAQRHFVDELKVWYLLCTK